MPDLLSDKLNLEILKRICTGTGLDINLRQLSRNLNHHRNTIRDRVRELQLKGIIDRPIYPFLALFKEYPLLVTVFADLPDDEKITEWLKGDKHIFAAFKIREDDYNTMIFEFHKSAEEYMNWHSKLVEERRIPEREELGPVYRIPSTPYYYSNKLILKYESSAPIKIIQREVAKQEKFVVYNYQLDRLAIDVLTCLVNGVGIKVNETFISKQLGVHRVTLRKRIEQMLQHRLISPPICRFPNFFVPPGFILTVSMVEIKRRLQEITKRLLNDPHITLIYQVTQGRHNLLLFAAHRSLEDYLVWVSKYENEYQNCLGSIRNTLLSPKMTISIDQQKVSLGIIEERLELARSRSSNS